MRSRFSKASETSRRARRAFRTRTFCFPTSSAQPRFRSSIRTSACGTRGGTSAILSAFLALAKDPADEIEISLVTGETDKVQYKQEQLLMLKALKDAAESVGSSFESPSTTEARSLDRH